MLGDSAPGWLNLAGLVTSIAVSVGVILAAGRRWFQRVVKEAVEDQMVEITDRINVHSNDDAVHFAEIRALLNRKLP